MLQSLPHLFPTEGASSEGSAGEGASPAAPPPSLAARLPLYFALARGTEGAPACDMSKYLDTNYHFIAPELTADSGGWC